MKRFQQGFIALLAVLAIGASVAFAVEKTDKPAEATAAAAEKPAEPQMVERDWSKRCTEGKDKKQYCEVFKRLDMKDSAARVAELAVGFPEGKDVARGVVILPLGILLTGNVGMKIDDGKPAIFDVRFCTASGCVSYVNLNKGILDGMKKGKSVIFFFKTADGQDVNLVLALSGFAKSISGVL